MVRRAARAFTLIEVILVIAVVSVLMAIVVPDWRSAGEGRRLAESVDRFQTLVAMCRAEAINTGRTYRLVFRVDGTVLVQRQLDPYESPEAFVLHEAGWARRSPLLKDIWVEAVLPLPDGLPAEYLEDESIGYEIIDEEEYELILVEDLDEDLAIDFAPDGSTDSCWWVLRAENGEGVQMTLDGRTGRIERYEVEPLDAEDAEPPEPEELDPDAYYYDPELVDED